MSLADYFAGSTVRRMAREEAIIAIRDKGRGAVSYLLERAQRSPDLQRRQVYRIAATLVPKILAEEDPEKGQ
jgi:hypothetical protein